MKSSAVRFLSLVASLVLLAFSIFVYSVLIAPSYAKVNKLRGELAAKKQLVTEQKKIVSHLANLVSQYEGAVNAYKTGIAHAIPADEEYPSLVGQISFIAKTSGLFLETASIAPLPQAQKIGGNEPLSKLHTVQMSISAAGPYPAFKSFLRSLETNIRVMDVVSAGVQTGVAGSQNLHYNVVISAYYQPF
jgi:Tfp pilus assembly protein PilO